MTDTAYDPSFHDGILDISDCLEAYEKEKNLKLTDGVYVFETNNVVFKRTQANLKMLTVYFDIYQMDGTTYAGKLVENFILDKGAKQQIGAQRLNDLAIAVNRPDLLKPSLTLSEWKKLRGYCQIRLVDGTFMKDGVQKDCKNAKIKVFILPERLKEFVENERADKILSSVDTFEADAFTDDSIPF